MRWHHCYFVWGKMLYVCPSKKAEIKGLLKPLQIKKQLPLDGLCIILWPSGIDWKWSYPATQKNLCKIWFWPLRPWTVTFDLTICTAITFVAENCFLKFHDYIYLYILYIYIYIYIYTMTGLLSERFGRRVHRQEISDTNKHVLT